MTNKERKQYESEINASLMSKYQRERASSTKAKQFVERIVELYTQPFSEMPPWSESERAGILDSASFDHWVGSHSSPFSDEERDRQRRRELASIESQRTYGKSIADFVFDGRSLQERIWFDRKEDGVAAVSPLASYLSVIQRQEAAAELPIIERHSAALIHAQFHAASEVLIERAKDLLHDAEVQEAARMHRLGFMSNPLVKKHTAQIEDLLDAEKIVPYLARYAVYGKRFILPRHAETLAKRYHLLIGRIDKFTGQLPGANLTEIEQFQAAFDQERDGAYRARDTWNSVVGFYSRSKSRREPQSMMIAAPEADFDTRGMEKRGAQLVDDPIVLQPVVGGYLIVTAWGPEASDPGVTAPDEN